MGKGELKSVEKKREDGEEGKQDGGMNDSRIKREDAKGNKKDDWIAVEMRGR